MVWPSTLRSVRMRTRWNSAATMALPRAFATRNMRVGTPSMVAITALREKMRRAVGRENLANTSPVVVATSRIPHKASTTTTECARRRRGVHLAVPDGGHRLHAEEEQVGER